jgi:hypothetical protein
MNAKYSVITLRNAGLDARWTRNRNGAPIIVARDPQAKLEHQRRTWWAVGKKMWDEMGRVGVREGFDNCTLLGDFFSLPA